MHDAGECCLMTLNAPEGAGWYADCIWLVRAG